MIARVLVGILFIILGWNSITKSGSVSDFKDYYQAAGRFLDRGDIYSVEDIQNARSKIQSLEEIFLPENLKLLEELTEGAGSYIYPPTFAFLLIPLSILEYESASLAFSILSLFSLMGVIAILYFYFIPKMNSNTFWVSLAIAIMVCFRFLENHVNNNQVAFLLLFLILLSVHTKKYWLSGLLLSLAIVIKITPAIFLIYFFWKRRYSAILWTVVFGMGWIFLPGIFFWEENLRYMIGWNELVLQSAMATPLFRAWQNNQSIIATLAKYFLEYADLMNQSAKGMPWVVLNPRQVQNIFYLIFLGFGYSLLRGLYNRASPPSDSKVLSLLFILSVLFSGIAWIHSFAFFLYPIFFLTKEWREGGLSSIQKQFLLVAMGLILIANRNLIGSELESWAFMISVFMYAGVILYFLILTVHHDSEAPSNKNTIRIAVDARPLSYGVTGNSRYLAEVLKILGKESDRFEFHLYSHKRIHPVFQKILDLPAISLISDKSLLPGPIWLHTYFPIKSYTLNTNVLWGTLQLLPAIGKFCPMIVNYHDLNVQSYPETMVRWNYFQHKLFCKRTLKLADSVLCLSKNTMNDIAYHYPKYSNKSVLAYPGVNSLARPIEPIKARIFGNYLFTIGTLEPRKNLKTLLNSYLRLLDKNPNYPYSLVIAGRSGWGSEEAILESELRQAFYENKHVYFLEIPSEEELSWLYKNCIGFLFPSLHEGFGLPLLEAMRENKFCIASDIPVFREICEVDRDILVPPLDESMWIQTLEIIEKELPQKRIWNPKNWTWGATSKIIANEIVKL